jgi:hypothetical protein
MNQIILDPHGVKGTCTDAIPETETRVLACVWAILDQFRGSATLYAEIIEFFGDIAFDLDTAPESDLWFGVTGSLAGKLRHSGGDIGTAGATFVGWHVGVIDDRGSVCFATCESTAATVGARQSLSDNLDARVLFDIQDFGRNGQNTSRREPQAEKCQNGYSNHKEISTLGYHTLERHECQ